MRPVCLSVCLFGFGAQTTGWIPTKFGMKQKGITQNPNLPHMAQDRGRNPFAAPFAQLKGYSILFCIVFLSYLNTFKWAERRETSQWVGLQRVRSSPHPASLFI